MNALKVNGTQIFMGINIPVIEGGFGKNCRVISTKTISEIHEVEIKRINELINNNIKRFKENIDIIDLLSCEDFKVVMNDLGLKGSNRTKNVYILSERGYAKLIKIMDSDKAWEVHDQLIDEYFAMRKVIKSSEQLKAQLLLSIYGGGQGAVIASKQLTELEVKEATTPLLQKNTALNNENDLLSQKNLEWDYKSLINSLVRAYATSINIDFAKAWNNFKKELLYKHSINLNARITNYLNTTGKKTKPKTLDMLDKSELPNATSTIVSLCRENNVDIDDLLNNKAS